MRQNWNMGQHFMVNKLIALGCLNNAIKRQHPSKAVILKDLDMLQAAVIVIENFGHAKRLSVVIMQCFGKTLAHSMPATTPSPRSNSRTRTSVVSNISAKTPTAFHGWASPHINTSKAA